MGFGFKGNEEAEREVPVGCLGKGENSLPVVQLPLERHLLASELLRLEIVVRSPRSRPFRGQMKAHLRLEIVARRHPDERRADNPVRYGHRVARVRGRLLETLLINNWRS